MVDIVMVTQNLNVNVEKAPAEVPIEVVWACG